MRRINSVILGLSVAFIAGMAGACSTNSAPTKEYYEGEFIYFADAATMTDCATGAIIPICNEGKYLEAERGYVSMGAQGGPVMIDFYGRRVVRKSMEGDRDQVVMVIDSLIGFDQTVMCNPKAIVSGVYEGKTTDSKYIIRLKPNYTYSQSIFSTDSSGDTEAVSSGRWYLSAGAELVLVEESPKSESSTFEVVRSQNVLVKNSGGKPLVLNKVYM